MKRHWN